MAEFNAGTDKETVEKAVSSAVKQMEAIFANHDSTSPDAYDRAYNEFMSHFPAYNAARREAEESPDGKGNFKVYNPIFGHKTLTFKRTSDERADELTANAKAASDALAEMPLEERLKVIKIIGEKLEKYNDAIMLAITADTGKPIDIAQKEMTKGRQWVDYVYENSQEQLEPEVTQSGVISKKTSKPLGGALITGASNYPFALAVDGILAAFAAGNGVIVSATTKAPNWAFPFMQAAQEAVDEYANNLGPNKRIAGTWEQQFVQNKDEMFQVAVGSNTKLTNQIPIMQFVGSTEIGETIKKDRGHKPTIAEMGGNNVTVVMESGLHVKADAKKPDSHELGAEGIAKEIIGGIEPVGARCTAPRILCVQEGAREVADILTHYADHPEAYLKEGDTLVGNPFSKGVKHGPMIDNKAHDEILDVIKLAHEISPNRDIVHGKPFGDEDSNDPKPHPEGYWMRPVIVDLRSVDMEKLPEEKRERLNELLRNEVFGPLLFITHEVKNIEEAKGITNRYDTHKLAGSIYTSDIEEGKNYFKETGITAGNINGPSTDLSPAGHHGNGVTNGFVGGPDYIAQFAEAATVQSVKISRGM